MDIEKREINVLIVEDDKLLALIEERLVTKLGYNVVGKAATGEEAIHKVAELNPDVVLIDISLKGEMDGIEAVEQIRRFSPVPVIYLSGNADNYNFERARKTDFVSYLIKPVTKDELTEPLMKAVRQNLTISNIRTMRSRDLAAQ